MSETTLTPVTAAVPHEQLISLVETLLIHPKDKVSLLTLVELTPGRTEADFWASWAQAGDLKEMNHVGPKDLFRQLATRLASSGVVMRSLLPADGF